MSIGTSKGAYYDDAFHREAAAWDPKYDNNEVSPDELQDKQNYKSLITQASGTMPFPDNHNPDLDFNNRFGNLPPAQKNIEDRRDQEYGIKDALQDWKQWGHDQIHPDAPQPIPESTPLAEELGYSAIDKIQPDPNAMSNTALMFNDLLNDAIRTGRIFKGMYDAINPPAAPVVPEISQKEYSTIEFKPIEK